MEKNILFLTQYFPPEVGATQSRADDMVNYLTNHGWKVTVITEFPNHPSGIIPDCYRGKLLEREISGNSDIIRVWVKTSPKKNFFNRIVFYLTYCINAVISGGFLREKYVIIFATSPPLFTAIAGLLLHWIKGGKFVVEIRDLWPKSAVSLGELKNRTAIKFSEWLENLCYQHADQIITVTNGVKNHLLTNDIPANKLSVVENGANTELFKYDAIKRRNIRQELGLKNKFVVIYAGIMGIAQGLEVVIKAASLLSDNPEFHFLLKGEGPEKYKLIQYADNLKLKNVTFLPESQRTTIPGFLSAADIALIPLKDNELFRSVVPSKLFDAWACECPVILGVDGEARQLLESCKGGYFVPPEDPISLIGILQEAKQNPTSLHEMGKRGRNFTENHFSRIAQAQKLNSILEIVLNH